MHEELSDIAAHTGRVLGEIYKTLARRKHRGGAPALDAWAAVLMDGAVRLTHLARRIEGVAKPPE